MIVSIYLVNWINPSHLGKETRSSTQHPHVRYISCHRLSPKQKSFQISISYIEIPKTVEDAFRNDNWEWLMVEEMRALEKTELGI